MIINLGNQEFVGKSKYAYYYLFNPQKMIATSLEPHLNKCDEYKATTITQFNRWIKDYPKCDNPPKEILQIIKDIKNRKIIVISR